MYVGMRVTISGLSSRPELNGMTGTALSFESAKGRYAVQLASGGGATLALKAANLSLAADEDEQAAPTPGTMAASCSSARATAGDELRQLIEGGTPADFTRAGARALHRAATNGHLAAWAARRRRLPARRQQLRQPAAPLGRPAGPY